MTLKTNSTILIGLDGATFTILDPLIEAGKMPFLGNLMASGVRAQLRSTVPPTTPPAWTSLMTGRSPANHGIFDFFVPESPGSPSLRLVNSRHITCETIWSLLTRNGLTSINLNFPVMSPPIPVSGYSISGFVPWKYLRSACHPPHLMDDLKKIPGFVLREMAHDFKMEEKVVVGCSSEEADDWVSCHTTKDRQWVAVLEHLMRTDPCHLTAIVLDSPDRLQHAFWPLMDPAVQDGPLSEEERRVRARIEEHFVRLDRLIARIVEAADPEADIFIASDHGFGPSRECFFLNTWLAGRGYLAWAEDNAVAEAGHADFSMDAIRRHGHLLNREKTLAHVLTPSSNGIRIPIKRDGASGGVRPEEYEPFLAKLGGELRAIRHPAQGFPIVKEVWNRNQVFGGAANAPDLTMRLWDNGLVSTLKADNFIKTRASVTGVHYPDGVFIANGPGIRRGVALDALHILDVAPTLLYSMGLPIPEDYEGRVPLDAFEPELVKSRPVRIGAQTVSVDGEPATGYERNEEEQAEVMRKLKELGYME